MESGLAVTSAREIFTRARRLAPLVGLIALLAVPAGARAGGPQPLLPDLMQQTPTDIRVQQNPDQPGDFQLGFSSTVGNVGAGPIEIHGVLGADAPDMTAYQVIHMSDGSTTQDTGHPIGLVHYDTDPTHDHWHFQPFDDYELRTLSGTLVAPDQKEGFCLINSLPVPVGTPLAGPAGSQNDYNIGSETDGTYFCHKGHPEATEITEGISVGWADEYTPFRGGQDVDITNVPAGRYYLVHSVNTNHSIQELDDDFANNVATATVDLSWPNGPNALPAVKVLRTCLAADTCPYTDPPAPPAPPPPGPDTSAPKLLLGGATRQRFLRGRAIYVYAKCDEVCTLTASGQIAALQVAKSLRTASTKLTLKPGVRTKIKLPISKRIRAIINRQLARGARVVVRVSLVATDAAGNRTTSKRTLTLLRNR
jgi:Lysyl oxidase